MIQLRRSQTDLTLNDTAMLGKGIISRFLTPQTRPFSEPTLQSDEKVKFYSGLPNFKVLKAVFDHVAKATSNFNDCNCKLTKFQEFMVVMLKLRLNCQLNDLGYRFDVSQATISRIMMNWIKAMCTRLNRLIFWPHRDSLQKTMPSCFRASIGNRDTVKLDCFEVFIERPSNLQDRTYTWSSY